MGISSELIYLAEQIAEEKGKAHAWVEQLCDIAEELSEENGGVGGTIRYGSDLLKEIDIDVENDDPMKQLAKLQDVAKDVLPDLFENILGQVQATGHKSHAEWTEEQVLEMWEARDRTKRRTKTIEHIADTLELSRFNVGEFIQEYEENNDNV